MKNISRSVSVQCFWFSVLAGPKIGVLGIGLCCDLVLLRLVNYIGNISG